MNLTELTGIKSKEQGTLADAINDLIKAGKVKLRSGAFSVVLIPKDLDYVYKIWTVDKGWEQFLEYVKANPKNEHLPKIIGRVHTIPFTFKRPSDFETMLHIVRVEKLDEISQSIRDEIILLVKFLRSANIDKLVLDDVPEIISQIEKTEKTKITLSTDFIADVLNVLHARGLVKSDFHADNVMQRSDKTLVIIDPYFDNSLTITASDIVYGQFFNFDRNKSQSGR